MTSRGKAKSGPVHTLTREEYDDGAAGWVNWSTLKYILDSPKHYQHQLRSPKEATDAMRLGSAVHTAVFEPEKLDTAYAVWSEGRRAGNDWKAFCEAAEGRAVITQEQYLGAQLVAEAVRAHPVAGRLLKKGIAEGTLLWTDPETGIKCKARLDWITARHGVDLKSSNTIDARQFGRSFGAMRSHGQLGFYNLGLVANGLKRSWKVIAVENAPPFDVAVYTVDDDAVFAGEGLAKEALQLLARCRKGRRWPGRYPKALPLELPPWHYADYGEDPTERLKAEGLI